MLLLVADAAWFLLGFIVFRPLFLVSTLSAADDPGMCPWRGMRTSSVLMFLVKLALMGVLGQALKEQWARFEQCRGMLRAVRQDRAAEAGGGVGVMIPPLCIIKMPPWPILGVARPLLKNGADRRFFLVSATELVSFATGIMIFKDLGSYAALPDQCRVADPSTISRLRNAAVFMLAQSLVGVPLALWLRKMAYRSTALELEKAKWS